MMKNFILILALAVVLTSCFEDPGTDVLFDETFVELDAAGTATNSRTFTYLRRNDGQTQDLGSSILLASRPLSTAVNVSFVVDPASTAVEGLHYNLNSTSVTIPAGEFSAEMDIDVIPDAIEVGEQLSLIIKLSSADVDINTELDSAGLLLEISCPVNADFTGMYRVETINAGVFGASTYGGDGNIVDISAVGDFGRVFTANYFEDDRFPRNFEFSLICERVKVPFQDHLVGCGGNDVNLNTGPPDVEATFDPDDDSEFIINLTDNVDSDCGGGPVQASYRFVKQ